MFAFSKFSNIFEMHFEKCNFSLNILENTFISINQTKCKKIYCSLNMSRYQFMFKCGIIILLFHIAFILMIINWDTLIGCVGKQILAGNTILYYFQTSVICICMNLWGVAVLGIFSLPDLNKGLDIVQHTTYPLIWQPMSGSPNPAWLCVFAAKAFPPTCTINVAHLT